MGCTGHDALLGSILCENGYLDVITTCIHTNLTILWFLTILFCGDFIRSLISSCTFVKTYEALHDCNSIALWFISIINIGNDILTGNDDRNNDACNSVDIVVGVFCVHQRSSWQRWHHRPRPWPRGNNVPLAIYAIVCVSAHTSHWLSFKKKMSMLPTTS